MDNYHSHSGRPNFFYSVGRFAHKWRWVIIAAWVCLLGFALVFAPKLSSVLKAGSFLPSYSESYKGNQLPNATSGWLLLLW